MPIYGDMTSVGLAEEALGAQPPAAPAIQPRPQAEGARWVSDGCQMGVRWVSDECQIGTRWVSDGKTLSDLKVCHARPYMTMRPCRMPIYGNGTMCDVLPVYVDPTHSAFAEGV